MDSDVSADIFWSFSMPGMYVCVSDTSVWLPSLPGLRMRDSVLLAGKSGFADVFASLWKCCARVCMPSACPHSARVRPAGLCMTLGS